MAGAISSRNQHLARSFQSLQIKDLEISITGRTPQPMSLTLPSTRQPLQPKLLRTPYTLHKLPALSAEPSQKLAVFIQDGQEAEELLSLFPPNANTSSTVINLPSPPLAVPYAFAIFITSVLTLVSTPFKLYGYVIPSIFFQ